MKKYFLAIVLLGVFVAFAQNEPAKQKTKILPAYAYVFLRDSCTQMDIVFTKGGSMSLEGRNIGYFTSFISNAPATPKVGAVRDALIMWVKNGREALSGDIYFTSDTSAYIQFQMDSNTFVNSLTTQGAIFMQKRGR